jgi:hypothetical protein
MGQKIKNPRELLEHCFSAIEWEYLKHHHDFKVELKKGCKTIEDFERLSTMGDKLLTRRDFEQLLNPPLHRGPNRKRS